eukprot:46802-Chlamydomonas_euryale.AAC.1
MDSFASRRGITSDFGEVRQSRHLFGSDPDTALDAGLQTGESRCFSTQAFKERGVGGKQGGHGMAEVGVGMERRHLAQTADAVSPRPSSTELRQCLAQLCPNAPGIPPSLLRPTGQFFPPGQRAARGHDLDQRHVSGLQLRRPGGGQQSIRSGAREQQARIEWRRGLDVRLLGACVEQVWG